MRIPILLSLLFFLAVPTTQAQFSALPGMPEPNAADMEMQKFHLLSVADTIDIFHNVRTRFRSEILNKAFPCRTDGQIRVMAPTCDVQMTSQKGYEMIVHSDGKMTIYGEWKDKIVELGSLYLRTIEPDTTDPDFLRVHPKWNQPLEAPEAWAPDAARLVEDDNLILVSPMAVYQWVHGDVAFKVHAGWYDGCEPRGEIVLEAEGFRFEPLSGFNNYKMIPGPERMAAGAKKAKKRSKREVQKQQTIEWVDVKAYSVEDGAHIYLDEVRLPVGYGRKPGAMD